MALSKEPFSMIKVYGSEMCPDCVACKANFDRYGIEYQFIDINKNLKDLRQFLIYRDTLPVFEHLKSIHDIGLPACVDGDDVFTDWESFLKEKGFEPFYPQEKKSCSLDHRGC